MWSRWVQGNSNGPLVPMVRLVPIEKHINLMVLLVDMHLIKGALDYFLCDLDGYKAIPMVHWYQWYDWYQEKTTSFKWLYWWICISLRRFRLFFMWSRWVQGNSDGPLVPVVRLENRKAHSCMTKAEPGGGMQQMRPHLQRSTNPSQRFILSPRTV